MLGKAYENEVCSIARALEVVGERWAMMIVRDLLVGPKRFGELQRGLPKIPTNILTARLKELEAAGVVRRRASAQPGGGVLYELTERGAELEAPVLALGRWGAKNLLDQPRPDEIVTNDSIIMALRTTFRPETANGTQASYELRMGPIVVHARVCGGKVDVGAGPLADADVVIEAGPELKSLMAREITPQEAIDRKLVQIAGDRKLFERFTELFRI
jgi:DNA-binding HxlR family transcriptional regulator